MVDTYKNSLKWEKIKPINNFDDIEVGKRYHIPPVNGKRRKDVYIKYKYQYSLDCYELGGDPNNTLYLYKVDPEIGFMSEIK